MNRWKMDSDGETGTKIIFPYSQNEIICKVREKFIARIHIVIVLRSWNFQSFSSLPLWVITILMRCTQYSLWLLTVKGNILKWFSYTLWIKKNLEETQNETQTVQCQNNLWFMIFYVAQSICMKDYWRDKWNPPFWCVRYEWKK